MKYKILLMPWLWTFDDDPDIEWKTPSLAFFNKYWEKLKRWNARDSSVVIWTWRKRVCYNIKN